MPTDNLISQLLLLFQLPWMGPEGTESQAPGKQITLSGPCCFRWVTNHEDRAAWKHWAVWARAVAFMSRQQVWHIHDPSSAPWLPSSLCFTPVHMQAHDEEWLFWLWKPGLTTSQMLQFWAHLSIAWIWEGHCLSSDGHVYCQALSNQWGGYLIAQVSRQLNFPYKRCWFFFG